MTRKSNQVKNSKAKIELLGSYDPEKQLIIEDPYYVSTAPGAASGSRPQAPPPHAAPPSPSLPQGNDSDFETVYQQCVRCCRAFLDKAR